jgi:hypothetical protein
VDNNIPDVGEQQNDAQRKGRDDHSLNRLKAFDKHYLEKSSLVKIEFKFF